MYLHCANLILILNNKNNNYYYKTLFTISFDQKEEHLDLVRKKTNSIDNIQIQLITYKIIPLVFDVSHCNVISINIALSFFGYHYFFCLSHPPIYYRLLDPYLLIIFSNNVFIMQRSLVKQKPFATEIKYTKIIFTIISKRHHKKYKKVLKKLSTVLLIFMLL